SHKTRVAPAECWTRVSIPFAEFAQDGWGLDAGELRVSDLSSINFELAQGQTYEIFLDELAFYSGPAPEEEVHCGMGGAGGAGGADECGPRPPSGGPLGKDLSLRGDRSGRVHLAHIWALQGARHRAIAVALGLRHGRACHARAPRRPVAR